ncbi:MAG: DUF4351 domain-containing protein [Magnetococcales bacterium]|nr:DUF4351 domain-containing protein [Magnetococcales bacterium]
MPYITNAERARIEMSERKGRAETLLQLIQRRFGAVPEPVRSRVTSANLKDLETWTDRIFDADSAQAVLQ